MSNQEEEFDPFDQENVGFTLFVVQARIYDVLLALLQESNPAAAKDLLEVHAGGNIVGAAPYFNGTFVTNIVNPEVEEEETDTMDENPLN